MLKKIANSVLAASVALSPIGASASEQFMFRYKTPVQSVSLTPPPAEDVEYGIGNDIVAYYVAPVGYDFAKKIPVVTQDVVEWRRDLSMDDIPGGIALDTASGIFSGTPAAEEIQSTLFHGYDRSGNRIARAEIHFNVFEPVGVPAVVDYYTHTNTYFYAEIPQPEGVTVHTWVPVDGVTYPDGMSMMNGAFQGTPAAAGSTGLAWRGYDYMGREVAFAYGDIVVADGPFVEELLADGTTRTDFLDQVRDKGKGESFRIAATVRKSLGPVTYRLVPETTRPGGLSFSSAGGVLGGIFEDYDTTATFRIEARDSFDGTTGLSDPFTLTTLPSVANIGTLNSLSGTVGTKYEKRLTSSGIVPGARWEVAQGSLPAGLILDDRTGTISGTPTEVGTSIGIVIRVSGPGMIPDESSAIDFRIYPEAIEATTEDLHVRTATPFATNGLAITKGVTAGYTIGTTTTLPGDLSIDSTTGVVSSAAGLSAAGNHDIPIYVDNGRRATFPQILRSYNPLEVSYGDVEVTRHQWKSVNATLAADSIIGKRSFSIADTDGDPIPDWMTFDTRTGRITVKPDAVETADKTFGPYVVTVRDDQDHDDSEPFSVKVNDREPMTIAINDRDVERFVGNGYRLATQQLGYGGVTYSAESLPSNWPATLDIREDGWLVGTTTDPVGTVYSGIVLKVADNDGSSATAQAFDLTVREPDGLGGLYGWLNMSLEWTAGQQFSDNLPPLRNGFGQVTYAFTQAVGALITDAATGAFSGSISESGEYAAGFTIDDETDRPAATGTLSIKINEKPEFSAPSSYDLNRAASFDATPQLSGGTRPITYALSGTLPEGLTFSGGRIHGTPTAEGTFPVTIRATDKAGASASTSFDLRVGPPLPFKLSYEEGPFTYGTWAVRYPRKENALGSVSYDAPVGTIPQGLRFSADGYFIGTPSETGRFGTVTVNATDGEGRPATATIDMNVTRAGEIDFPDITVRHRKGTTFTDTLAAGNAVDPVTFSSADPAGMPYDLVLNGATGTITGSFAEEGTYPVSVAVKDDFDREATSVVTFEIIGDYSVSAEDASLKQFASADATPAATVVNETGASTFVLASGSLPDGVGIDPATGAVTGTPETAGAFSGITIRATDPDGTSAVSNEFTVTVAERDALVVEAPPALSLKRFGTAQFSASTTDAIPPVAYSVTPDLPAGLVLDRDIGSISGSSEEIVADTVYTITATDSKGGDKGTDVAQFTLSVAERDPLGIEGAETVEFARYVEGSAAYTAVDAIGPVAFSISPDLPAGLTFDASSGTISGTAEEAMAASTYVVTATDEKGGDMGTSSISIALSVKERSPLAITGPDTHEFEQYIGASVGFSPVDAIGEAVFSISPDLPAGLALDAASGAISGTAEATSEPAAYTITAVDSKGGELGTSTKTVTLAVKERPQLEASAADIAATRYQDYAGAPASVTSGTAVGTVTFSVTPGLPEGLSLDASTGAISGTPSAASSSATYTLTAIDSIGGQRGTDTVQFTISVADRAPLVIEGPASYEFAQYSEGEATYSAPAAIGSAVFAIDPTLPEGISLDPATGRIHGSADEQIAPSTFTLTVTDDHDTTTKQVSISVGERKALAFVTSEMLTVIMDHDIPVSLELANVVGEEVTWELLDGSAPEGMTFDASSGTFTGAPTEFGATSSATIRTSDAFGGTAERTFTFKVIQDGTPITLSLEASTTRVGNPFSFALPAVDNIVGAQVWAADTGATGLVINRKTGQLTGTPAAAFTTDVTVAVTDATGRTASATATATSVPPMSVTAPDSIDLVFGRDVPTGNAATASDSVGAVTWTAVGRLPDGISLDPATGEFKGQPRELGTFSGIVISATDTLPGRASSNPVTINVSMNEDPLELSVTDFATKTGLPVITEAPVYSNNVGPVTFFSNDLAGTGLSIDPVTGIITGSAGALTDVFINVSVRDSGTLRVTSKPLHYRVLPPMQITIPAQVTLTALTDITPVKPTRNYVVDPGVWEPIDESVNKLPEGIVFDTATGTLKGNATELGTYGPFAITSTDAVGDRGTSNSFVIKVNPGAFFLGLAKAPQLPDGLKRLEEYSYDFRQHLTTVGMDESEVTWSLGAGSPPGLSLANGVLSGIPTLSGIYTFDVKVSFGTVSATRSYTMDVKLPETELTLASATLPVAKRKASNADNSYSFDLTQLLTIKNIDPSSVQFSLEPFSDGESFPAELSISGGSIVGTTTSATSTHSFRIRAQFKDSTDEDVSSVTAFAMDVIDEISFSFNTATMTMPQKRISYSYDLGNLIDDATIKGVAKNELAWSWAIDPAFDPTVAIGTLPVGLGITGRSISGTAKYSTTHDVVLTASYDGRSVSKPYRLAVGLPTTAMTLASLALPDGEWRASYSHSFGSLLTTMNIPKGEVTYAALSDVTLALGETAGLPPGLTLSQNGTLSGTLTNKGKYRFKVKASWSNADEKPESAETTQEYLLVSKGEEYLYKSITAGDLSTCGATTAGAMHCWGDGSYNKLGGGSGNRLIPDLAHNLTSGMGLAGTGNYSTCVLSDAGGVQCWGYGGSGGTLGTGTTAGSQYPVTPVGMASGVKEIGSGLRYHCALKDDGTVECFGDSANGVMGTGRNGGTVATPLPATGVTGAVKLSVGEGAVCAVINDGGVMCWGLNSNGQLGLGNTASPVLTPTRMVGVTDAVDVATSGTHTCVLSRSGGIRCVGLGSAGQLGNNGGSATSLQQVQGITSGATSIEAGGNTTCAIVAGSAKCWGSANSGQLGNGSNSTGFRIPAQVTGLTSGVERITVGTNHACAIQQEGATWCWGSNASGKLGNNQTGTSAVPVRVGG
mgnify:CR=1 FL=1